MQRHGIYIYYFIDSRLRGNDKENKAKLVYIYYYNNVREHSSLDDKTPYEYLKEQEPDINDKIRYV